MSGTRDLAQRLRALAGKAVGADAVRALRRQMAKDGSSAAVWPDEHRIGRPHRNDDAT
ncbi:hypothetical protein AB0F81_21220 [Actinoplanes sp. NPDC024001]|uniref:hypothetical protein n=1 Tax=Actinoplanes sp. NPDC024001 TaxID=3154598 RepID=UPI0033FCFD4A